MFLSFMKLAAFALVLVVGCVPPGLETVTVPTEAVSQENPSVPKLAACAGCHQYPPSDLHHQFHLFAKAANDVTEKKPFNGAISCLDCHFGSIHVDKLSELDSIWMDEVGNKLTGEEKQSALESDESLKFTLIREYILERYQPHLQQKGSGIASIETGSDHFSGEIEVEFPNNNILPNFKEENGLEYYNKQQVTCSNIACHSTEGEYQWASYKNDFKGKAGELK